MNVALDQWTQLHNQQPNLIADYEAGQQQLEKLFHSRHKHFDAWIDGLDAFYQNFQGARADFSQPQVSVRRVGDLSAQQLTEKISLLMPWRKGPFAINDIDLDCEWRSDYKFQRVLDSGIDFSGKSVLDVGTGSGYFLYRLLGSQAKLAVGVDPSWHYFAQYLFLQSLFQSQHSAYLPCTLDHVALSNFDIVMSMGVFYHRKDPFAFLSQLKSTIKKGGQLILETLVVDGDENTVYLPRERYYGMKNVWFLPSRLALKKWLEKVGFTVEYMGEAVETTEKEQRRTQWMQSYSLPEFIATQTDTERKENPPPKRLVIIASTKA